MPLFLLDEIDKLVLGRDSEIGGKHRGQLYDHNEDGKINATTKKMSLKNGKGDLLMGFRLHLCAA